MKTKEPQYQEMLAFCDANGISSLGIMTNQDWSDDPRRLLFLLSRYKFVAKMLSGKKRVLEVGCGDAFGTRIVLQEVGQISAIDFDPIFVKNIRNRMDKKWGFKVNIHNILSGPVRGTFDAAYMLDVLEHIPAKKENICLSNIVKSIKQDGVLIVGIPSIQSQMYASKMSKEGHINCKDSNKLKKLMLKYFYNVFMFSMNDEMVHTGFYPMAHYLFGLGVGVKKRN